MSTVRGSAPLVGFKRHLRAEVAGDDRVFLFAEHGMTVLGGLAAALAPLLDGSRDLTTLLDALPAGLDRGRAAELLNRLTDAGLIMLRDQDEPVADAPTLAYWEGAGLDATVAVTGTTTGTVAVRTVGSVDAGPTRAALRAAGLAVLDEPDTAVDTGADLLIVLCDDYLRPELAGIDGAGRRAGRAWLLAKPGGARIWLGPVFHPDGPGCWHCVAKRLREHRGAESCAQRALGRSGPPERPRVGLPALTATAAQLIALEATKWLAGHRDPHQHRIMVFDSLDLHGEHHEVRNCPQCPACGNPALVRERAHQPVLLTATGRVRDSSGGHRVLTPEEVRERYRHLVSPVTGIIKQIQRAGPGPAFFNSFRSGPNVAARTSDLNGLRSVLRMENGGKGTTPIQAEVSALCEAIERYSGTCHGDEERIRGSLRSLGERAIHPNACQLFHERQYRTRDAWNRRHSPFQYVGRPFDETTVTDWTPVWPLGGQEHRLVPTGLLYHGAPACAGDREPCADSNGNAAGGTLEDAVLQGLLEVVERDAVAIWWYNRSRVPGVDLDAFGDPWIDELRTIYADLGREVWVLDVTSDLDVPTMVAVSQRIDGGREDITFGFGAHLDPRIALRRSLTELNQLMPALLDAGHGRAAGADPDAEHWWRYATVANQPYVAPDPATSPRVPAEYGYTRCENIGTEIELIRRRIEAQGMELLVLDQTRPDIGLPVVKVLVPGMRHFWARFAPGRLYDVPVRLGRQSEPTRYENLNPIPMFL